MRFCTWNINSVRLRMPLLEKLMEAEEPDVICLQETKVEDALFPAEPIKKRGYKHIHICGMKSYNGVAILSKQPLSEPAVLNWHKKTDSRHVSARLKNGLEIHCVYVPAGGYEADPKAVKFAHKLSFVEEQAAYWGKKKTDRPRILMGDLNIAPLEHDVWSHEKMVDVVSHTPGEVERFKQWGDAHGWVDAVRHFVPENKKLYSWWSYRAPDWETADRGRRLDHVWVTQDLQKDLKAASVLRKARSWAQPSDHVPVIVDLR